MDNAQFQLNADLEMRHWWFVARREILKSLIGSRIAPAEEHRIVDIGCGTGGNLASLTDDYACCGIDPSPSAIVWAKKRFPNAQFICGLAPEDCREALENASLVMLNDVLEHVPDDFELFSKVLSVTRPGCRFLITVPADPLLWSPHDESHAHYRRYTLDRLQRIWQDRPIRVELLSAFNSRLYPIVRLVRSLSHRSGQSYGHSGTDLRLPHPVVNACLRKVFAGEQYRLQKLLAGKGVAYRRGVSLVALLVRTDGDVVPSGRPDDVAADVHQPRALQTTLSLAP